jgi:hypothetical protein
LLGDAGAMVLLTNPELFVTRELPVRVKLDGIGRGQTIVDQRAVRGVAGHDPDPRPRTAVAVDLDVAQAASAFVKAIDGYASCERRESRADARRRSERRRSSSASEDDGGGFQARCASSSKHNRLTDQS